MPGDGTGTGENNAAADVKLDPKLLAPARSSPTRFTVSALPA